jgi:hypothetical protein
MPAHCHRGWSADCSPSQASQCKQQFKYHLPAKQLAVQWAASSNVQTYCLQCLKAQLSTLRVGTQGEDAKYGKRMPVVRACIDRPLAPTPQLRNAMAQAGSAAPATNTPALEYEPPLAAQEQAKPELCCLLEA